MPTAIVNATTNEIENVIVASTSDPVSGGASLVAKTSAQLLNWPYAIDDSIGGGFPGYKASGRTLVSQQGPAAGETTGVFVCAGQSNSPGASFTNSQYTPKNAAKNQTLDLYTGAVHLAADPLASGSAASGSAGSWGGRLADKLIDAGIFQRVIIAPASIGGTPISMWTSTGNYYGNGAQGCCLERILVGVRRVRALGLSVSGFLWVQGENDQFDGTSQATYQAALTSIIASVRSRGTGFQAPWFVGLCTYNSGNTSSAVRAAQTAVVNGSDIFHGGDTDTIGAGSRHDNVHFNATGADSAAGLWKTALDAVF